MQLKPYANEVSGSYSGGNKRKLSAAISVCADPPVVLLVRLQKSIQIEHENLG
jgi:ABC-type multidrug transport system ATPase subunit